MGHPVRQTSHITSFPGVFLVTGNPFEFVTLMGIALARYFGDDEDDALTVGTHLYRWYDYS